MRILISLVSGALFGLGLIISGMTDTKKVQGWLDIFGEWDPNLSFCNGRSNATNGDRLEGHAGYARP
jgi:uncharacterized membrane protein YedE/YeeE